MTFPRYSPHYSIFWNQKNRDARRDAAEGPLEAALDALRLVASNDPDHARTANGFGFARSDVTLGHRLSKLTASQLRDDPGLAAEVMKMAARYRRQVPTSLRVGMGVTSQPDFFD